MGIFSRLNTVIKSNLNALIDDAEDPEKMIGQTIIDMQSEMKRAKRELLTTLGAGKRLDKEADELQDEVEGWERKAVLALKQGDDDLAREALKRKAKVAKKVQATRARAAENTQRAQEMKDMLETLETKLEDLEARKTSLASQVRQARQEPSATAGGTSRFGGGAFGELERMVGKIDQLDAEVEVASVLDDGSADVEARFRALEREGGDTAVEDELASLKAKLD